MAIEFTPEQDMFRDAVRDFCNREISREYLRACDYERRPPREAYEKPGELGWLGINIPTEYGGGGGGAVEVAIPERRELLAIPTWLHHPTFRTRSE